MVPSKQPKIGDHIRVSMHGDKIVDAVIKSRGEETGGLRYQVDFGHEQTARIHEWQVGKD